MEYNLPSELGYSNTHEWVRVEDDDIAVIGITDYAQNALGDIVYIEFPELGVMFERESIIGEIESVKAVDEIKTPISGEIVEINENLNDNPELVNESPYKDGWIFKVKITHPEEIEELLSLDEYAKFIEKESN
ncbi:MAG: glycine cleavage system protein GcvH [Promethearchaeota archaeon]|nr:MAG: glycine cleavage system protein GcvH [Candidatus Lokiarchaeota archaeon]